MIQVEGMCKTFGHTVALRDVSFHVQQGEVLGFLGPDGAGKTTTMRILTGYLAPSAGRATVAGFDVFTQSLEIGDQTPFQTSYYARRGGEQAVLLMESPTVDQLNRLVTTPPEKSTPLPTPVPADTPTPTDER